MNYKNNKKHITALLAAMAIVSSGYATTFNDTVIIQPVPVPPVTNSTPGGVGIDPTLGVNNGTSTQVFTQVGATNTVTTSVAGGGITLSTNGDANLAASQGSQTTYNYVRGVEVQIYNADQGVLSGTVVPGSQKDVGGYVDAGGNFVKIADLVAGEIPLATLEGLTGDAAAAVVRTVQLPATGGNLTVEGVTSTKSLLVNGVTGTNGISNTGVIGTDSLVVNGVTSTNSLVVDGISVTNSISNTGSISTDSLTIGGVAAATVNDVDAEANTRATEDTDIRREFRAADVTLQNNINDEAATRFSEDSKLQTNITNEANTRANDDAAIRRDFAAADVVLAGRATSLENRATALEGRMGRAESDIRSLRKGIAMSAALQTPVINDGDKQAVKVGAATYDGEQGLGLGYARRVNDSVTVNVDVATGFPETVARGGVNLSF